MMQNRALHILTNITALAESARPDERLCFSAAGSERAIHFMFKCLRSDLVIIDQEARRLLLACLVKWILPWSRFRIISVDLILRPPKSFAWRLRAFWKRASLKKVHRFILYFKDLRGYEDFYGVGPDRTIYVPFKVNDWEILQHRDGPSSAGDYVLCAGRTLRDTKTFVDAMTRAGCAGVLLQQSRPLLSEHGTEPWSGELPANVKLVIDEGNESKTFIEYISKARIVVIPRFSGDIAATGIGTSLLAMALNRCVIISEGPGASDVLTDQAVIVPPEDPAALATQVKSLWEDTSRRAMLISRGRAYANEVAGTKRLMEDILRASLTSFGDLEAENAERATNVLLNATSARK